MKRLRMMIVLSIGIITGILLTSGLMIFQGRYDAPGGEVLLLPVLAVFLYVGYMLGTVIAEMRR